MILLSGILCFAAHAQAQQAASQPLRFVQSIPMPGVKGRLDHMSVDVGGHRLYVSALGNNTVEVLDLLAGQVIDSIGNLREPQGVCFVPESGKLFVANGGDGTCRIYDAGSDQLLSTVHYPSDADDIRYDPVASLIYVGFGEGGLGVLNATTGEELGRIPLPAHPEGFEVTTQATRIYINVPGQQEIDVADGARRLVNQRWPMGKYKSNFPMGFDPANFRLFVVCRNPAEFLAFDAQSGKMLAHLKVVGDADDLYYDAARKRIYITGGEGAISVLEQTDGDHYRNLATVPTAPGARTSLFVPEYKRLYVGVPAQGSNPAEIRIYVVQP